MPLEPLNIRVVAFVDGQNLFRSTHEAFGYPYPNYDVGKFAQAVCTARGWQLHQTRFYTGVPDLQDHPFWHGFWSNKLRAMRRAGAVVFFTRLALPEPACRAAQWQYAHIPGW
ncbi:MAG: PIN domain-containing protein [Acidobacteriaceae bacterium]